MNDLRRMEKASFQNHKTMTVKSLIIQNGYDVNIVNHESFSFRNDNPNQSHSSTRRLPEPCTQHRGHRRADLELEIVFAPWLATVTPTRPCPQGRLAPGDRTSMMRAAGRE